uniref:N-acetyltransferase domain-containing protein n=1 Tax=Neobodo designis TaxID=312471 RepID=A0A7S1MQ65_NEODS
MASGTPSTAAGPSPAAAAAAGGALPALRIVADALVDVQLDGESQDRVVDLWLGASKEERLMIAQIYKRYFHDSAFVQRVHIRASLRQAKEQTGVGAGASRPASRSGRATPSEAASGAAGAKPRVQSVQARQLRSAIDEAVAKLPPGSGPHPVRFGVVSDRQLNTLAIQLYCTQFTQPEPAAMKEIVTIPRRTTTRTRRNPTGNFTWFLWCVTTNEMCCAVTATVHTVGGPGGMRFIEMPLFATASGYKKTGLGRLLNAALQEYCAAIKAAFILVSADAAAVPFWQSASMGYTPITRDEQKRVEFHYKTECNRFTDSVLLTWRPSDAVAVPGGVTALVDTALQKAPLLCLEGSATLPLP